MEVSGQLHAPAALPSMKQPLVPIGGSRGGEEKNSRPLSGHEPPTIDPVAQRYTSAVPTA